MEEEKIEISLNQEDVQNIINAYEKDLKYIEQLEQIIREAREYVENRIVEDDYMLRTDTEMVQGELLEILDRNVK